MAWWEGHVTDHGGCPPTAAYDYDKYRRLLRARGITPKIARKGTAHGSGLGRTRWVVERTFAWLHQFKRLRTATRYAPTLTSDCSNSPASSSA